jgi:hypothetical protein
MGRVDRYTSLRGKISLPGLGEPMANIPELTHVRIKCLNASLVIHEFPYRPSYRLSAPRSCLPSTNPLSGNTWCRRSNECNAG